MQLKNYIVNSTYDPLSKGHIDADSLLKTMENWDDGEGYYCINDLEPRPTFKEYEGLHRPALGWCVIDIDFDHPLKDENGNIIYLPQTEWELANNKKPKHKPDVPKNIHDARRATLNIIRDLELKDEWTRVFFSGSKGFHIYIRAEFFGITEATSTNANKLKQIVQGLSEKYGFNYDKSVYDTTRKMRLPNSVNPKSNLYKVEVDTYQLSMFSVEDFLNYAKKPQDISLGKYTIPETTYQSLADITVYDHHFKLPFLDTDTDSLKDFTSERNKVCVQRMISGELPVGVRHLGAVAVIIDSFDIGLTKEEAIKRIGEFCENNQLQDRLDQYTKDVYLKYSGKFPYKTGCYTGVKKDLCSGTCPLYTKLNKERRAVVKDAPKETPKDIIADNITKGKYPRFVHVKETKTTYTVLNTYENFLALANFFGITAKYNIIRKRVDLVIPGQEYHPDNEDNNKLSTVMSLMNQFSMPSQNADEYINRLADKHQYNPVANWVLSKKWDGVSRFGDLLDTVKTRPEQDTIKKIIFKRWLISCVAAAFEPKGFYASGVLVFVGKQSAGKTSWIKRLAPQDMEVIKTGLSIDTENKDSVAKAVSAWICELGELDATFGKSDVSRLKAFITNDTDEFRAPYARKAMKFQRRTIFYGSVNPTEFLNDPTGNRRFWPVQTDEVNYEHKIDVQQLWAEVYEWYKSGEQWWQTPEEFELLNEHNEQFTAEEPWLIRLEKLADYEPSEVVSSTPVFNELTSTEIAMACGVKNPTRGDTTKIGAAATKLNWEYRRYKSRRVWVFKSRFKVVCNFE